MNYYLTKKLCTLSVVCALAFSPVFAAENTNNEILQGIVKESATRELSEDYINSIGELLNRQIEQGKFEEAEITSNFYLEATQKFYGKHNNKTAYAYLEKARLYRDFIIPDLAVKNMKSANSILKWHIKRDKLRNDILSNYYGFHSKVGQNYNAIKTVNKMKPYMFPNGLTGKYKDIGLLYSTAGDTNAGSTYYKKALQQYNSDKVDDKYQLMDIYWGLIDTSTPRDEAFSYLNKLVETSNSIKNEDINSKININLKYLDVANSYNEIASCKKLLDDTAKMIAKNPNPDFETSIARYYISYNNETNQSSLNKKYYDVIKKYHREYDYSKLPSNSLILTKKYKHEIERSFDNLDKAQSYVDKSLKMIEPVKKSVPAIYAKFLTLSAEINLAKKDYESAKADLDKANSTLKQLAAEPKYTVAMLDEIYSEYYRVQGDLDMSMSYLNKALNNYIETRGEKSNEVINTYNRIAQVALEQGKTDKAMADLEKSINLAKSTYGENHVKTYQTMFNTYYIYRSFDEEKAEEIANTVLNAVESPKTKGKSWELMFQIYITKAHSYEASGNFSEVIKYAQKAEKYALNTGAKMEVYSVLSSAYSGNPRQKAQYLKYKKLLETTK